MGNISTQIHILATTDVHNRFDTFNYAINSEQTNGSMTQIASVISQFREEHQNTIVIDCGDMIQDNSASMFINDDGLDPMFLALNYIGYDSFSFGNHEFNYGPKYIPRFSSEPECPVLCGNIYNDNGNLIGKPYTIKEVDGIRIAIIGMTTPNCKVWDGVKYPDWTFNSPLPECKKAIQEIQNNNLADIIIGALHMGLHQELEYGDNVTDIVENCPEFDAIMCGHMHVEIDGEVLGSRNTIISEAGKFGEKVACITLTVEKDANNNISITDKKSHLIPIKGKPIDEKLDALMKPYHDRGVKAANQVIGELKGGSLIPECEVKGIPESQIQDNAMIHLLNDTIIHYGKKHIPKGAKYVSAMHLLNPMSNIYPGKISQYYLAQVYRYDNFIYVIKLTGKDIKTTMEWSAEYYNQFNKGDVSVSFNIDRENYYYLIFGNLKYSIDISKPNGQRIQDLTFEDGTPLNDDEEYYFITGSYIKDTILDSRIFANRESISVIYSSENEEIPCVRELVGEYIKNVKNGVITNKFTPNWKLTGVNYDPQARAEFVKLVNSDKIQIPDTGSDKHLNPKSFTVDDVKVNV